MSRLASFIYGFRQEPMRPPKNDDWLKQPLGGQMKNTILDAEHNVVPADTMTWARFFEDFNNRRVAKDELPGDVQVSTVFLGLDHSFGDGPPLWFETMVFAPDDKPFAHHTEWYTTWAEAEEGHRRIVAAVVSGSLDTGNTQNSVPNG